jgi:integrase
LRHNLFYARHFKPAVRRAGLPEALRFHDLRHTCAALLIAQGAHPKAIMERLGHSSIQVTLDRYGHLLPSLDETLTDGLEATYRASLAARTGAASQPVVTALR